MKNVREQLLKNTLIEIAKCGIGGVKLSNIAKTTGIKTPSIYAFYPSKDTLINESILWGERQEANNNFNIDFSLDVKSVLLSLYSHYIEEFSSGIKKDYFIVLSRESYNNKQIYTMYQNLLYSIESQINFILCEKFNTSDEENEKIMALSNILSYAFTRIMQTAINESKESAIWEAEDLITSCLYS